MCFTPPSPGSRPPAPSISELSSDAALDTTANQACCCNPALTTTPPVDIVNTLEILDTLSVVVFGCQYFMNEFQLIVPRKYAGTSILDTLNTLHRYLDLARRKLLLSLSLSLHSLASILLRVPCSTDVQYLVPRRSSTLAAPGPEPGLPAVIMSVRPNQRETQMGVSV